MVVCVCVCVCEFMRDECFEGAYRKRTQKVAKRQIERVASCDSVRV